MKANLNNLSLVITDSFFVEVLHLVNFKAILLGLLGCFCCSFMLFMKEEKHDVKFKLVLFQIRLCQQVKLENYENLTKSQFMHAYLLNKCFILFFLKLQPNFCSGPAEFKNNSFHHLSCILNPKLVKKMAFLNCASN